MRRLDCVWNTLRTALTGSGTLLRAAAIQYEKQARAYLFERRLDKSQAFFSSYYRRSFGQQVTRINEIPTRSTMLENQSDLRPTLKIILIAAEQKVENLALAIGSSYPMVNTLFSIYALCITDLTFFIIIKSLQLLNKSVLLTYGIRNYREPVWITRMFNKLTKVQFYACCSIYLYFGSVRMLSMGIEAHPETYFLICF